MGPHDTTSAHNLQKISLSIGDCLIS